MWMCDCDEHGKFDVRNFDKKPTTVTGDGICTRCESYAFWENQETKKAGNGSRIHKKVTVFRLKTGESKTFDNMVEAGKWAGYSHKYSLPNQLATVSEDYYHNTTKDIVVVLGHHKTIPKEVQEAIKPTQYYGFEYETGKLAFSGTLEEVVKLSKDSRTLILKNLNRKSIKTKNGYVYSKNKDFKLSDYKNVMELDVNWREDVIAFSEEELGVSYEEDNYGTWKELLYS